MNAEVSKIRKSLNYNEVINREPSRLSADNITKIVYNLNANMNNLYNKKMNNDIDIEEYASIFMDNIFIILNAFNEMGIYPDYFYDEIVKMNIDYKKIVQNNQGIRGNYRLFKEINLSASVSKAIKNGLEKGYHHIQAYQKKDINDAFIEMIGFFQGFNMPYGIQTEEQCQKVFSDIQFNHMNIVETLLNSDFLFEDIECFARLLFEYLTFYVAVGIHPKKFMDAKFELKEDTKTK